MLYPSIHLATMNAFVTAYSQSDFFGKLIILSLVSLSIICWIVLIYKIRITRNVKKVAEIFNEALEKNKERILSLELSDLPRPNGKTNPHPFGKIFLTLKQKTLEILNKNLYFSAQKSTDQVYLSQNDLQLLESHVLTTISAESKNLEKHLFILSTIVTLAPFLGLLGTVWGILISFSEMHGGASVGSNSAILGGLSTALSTTVLGLLIAIPALVAYNYLKNLTKTLSSDMEDCLYQLLNTIEMQYRKSDTP